MPKPRSRNICNADAATNGESHQAKNNVAQKDFSVIIFTTSCGYKKKPVVNYMKLFVQSLLLKRQSSFTKCFITLTSSKV